MEVVPLTKDCFIMSILKDDDMSPLLQYPPKPNISEKHDFTYIRDIIIWQEMSTTVSMSDTTTSLAIHNNL